VEDSEGQGRAGEGRSARARQRRAVEGRKAGGRQEMAAQGDVIPSRWYPLNSNLKYPWVMQIDRYVYR
jgi:hypothetical protein